MSTRFVCTTLLCGTMLVTTGCGVLETIGEGALDVAVFAVEGAGDLAETTVTTTIEVAGAAAEALVSESGDVTEEAIDTTARTTHHAARRGVHLIEDSNVRKVLALELADGSTFFKAVSRLAGTRDASAAPARYWAVDAAGATLPRPWPTEVRVALDRGR